jgi:NarL family two-component system response regulator LiaR
MSDCIRLLIADDHTVVRHGLHALVETVPDITIVGEAADGIEAVEQALALRPDVILLDLLMPRRSGEEAICEIRAANPEARILILTSFSDDDKILPALRAGAMGYLMKDSSPQALLRAIRAAHRGDIRLPPLMARKLADGPGGPSAVPLKPDQAAPPLTGQEMNVLRFLAQGLTNQAIAEQLAICERTVGLYVSSILKKLQLDNRTQAALYALREEWASLG